MATSEPRHEISLAAPAKLGFSATICGAMARKTALQLAKASLAVCSAIDFQAVKIDSALRLNVKEKLVNRTRSFLADQDARGLIPPTFEMGVVGENSRAISAACGPVFSQFFLKTHVGFSEI